MRCFFISVAVVCICLIWVCSCGSPGGGPGTLVSEDPKLSAKSSESARRYVVQTDSSYVTWVGSKITEKHYGRIGLSEGIILVENNQISSGSSTIDLQKLSVAHPEEAEEAEKLRTHLLSSDFFEAEAYPTAYFELVAIVPYDAAAFQDIEEYESANKPAAASKHRVSEPTHNITGNLSIRGTKRSLTFPARVALNEAEVKIEAKFNIDRSEWGISYGDENSVIDKAKDRFIYNTVNVGFVIQATVEAEEAP